MFCLPFERVAGGVFQIANIVPSLIQQLDTLWQAVNLQHACYNHKNVILNKNKCKPRNWHPECNGTVQMQVYKYYAWMMNIRYDYYKYFIMIFISIKYFMHNSITAA